MVLIFAPNGYQPESQSSHRAMKILHGQVWYDYLQRLSQFLDTLHMRYNASLASLTRNAPGSTRQTPPHCIAPSW